MPENFETLSLASDLFSPVVLTSDWESAASSNGNGSDVAGWKATFKRLWFSPAGGGYEEADWNQEEYDIYAPLSKTKPSSVEGDHLFAVFRGRWEAFEGGGINTPSAQYAVVVEAISQPSDVTASPLDGMGKIKFPTDEKSYDCGCLLLAETEQLLNEQVNVVGPFEYDNPEFDPQSPEDENNPKKLEYYLAVDIADGYDGLPLESELIHGETSTIKVQKDSDELEFTVHDGILLENQHYLAGTPVLVRRTAGKLRVVDGPCPEDIEEEEEPPEEEEEEEEEEPE